MPYTVFETISELLMSKPKGIDPKREAGRHRQTRSLNHIVHADVFSVVKIKMCVIAVNSLCCLTVLGRHTHTHSPPVGLV